jgi:aryl sulfotransferase
MAALLRAPVRELQTGLMDSRRWNGFVPRDDDIVIATFPKCGTTWMQRIVDLLVFQSPEPRPIAHTSPWLESNFFAPIEQDLATLAAQTHRRFIKTHLPFDSLPVFENVKYIHVARDGRDACLSMHNHDLGFRPESREALSALATQRGAPLRAQVSSDPRTYFLDWLKAAESFETDSFRLQLPFFEFENTYWKERRLPNLLFVHYNDLKEDLPGEMRRAANFLNIDVPKDRMDALARAAQFEAMRAEGAALMPGVERVFDRGADRFLNKGLSGQWRDVLNADDIARYDALARERLSPSAAAWIEKGRRGAGDPAALPD